MYFPQYCQNLTQEHMSVHKLQKIDDEKIDLFCIKMFFENFDGYAFDIDDGYECVHFDVLIISKWLNLHESFSQ